MKIFTEKRHTVVAVQYTENGFGGLKCKDIYLYSFYVCNPKKKMEGGGRDRNFQDGAIQVIYI